MTTRRRRRPDGVTYSATCIECGVAFDYEYIGKVRSVCSDACRALRRKAVLQRYWEVNQAKKRQYNRTWNRANRESVNAATRRWRERNPERVKEFERHRRYISATAMEMQRRRRARHANAYKLNFTPKQLAARFSMFEGCWICGRSNVRLEVDHVKPLTKGGAHILANIRPACRSCNSRKRNKWPFSPADLITAPARIG